MNQTINSWIESLHAYIKYSPAEITPLMKLESDMRKFLESEPGPTVLYIDTDGMCRAAQSVKDGQGTQAGSMAKMVIDCCDYIVRLTAELAETRKKPDLSELWACGVCKWYGTDEERTKDGSCPQCADDDLMRLDEIATVMHVCGNKDEIDRIVADIKAKDERIKEIQEYIRKNSGHHPSCGKRYGLHYACTCGFEQALKEE